MMTIKEIFKELDKREGKDLIISYSEVKEMSQLTNKQFHEVYSKWINFKDWKDWASDNKGMAPDGTYEEALLGIL